MRDDLNFYLAIAGGVGTLFGIYGFYIQWKSKKSQEYVFRLAQTVMEKEDTQSQLKASKDELSTIEKRLNNLQQQIKRDLPIEARKAVLYDRLDESLLNMKKYYHDVINTKRKLGELNVKYDIPDELLKAIQAEIEPRHLLEEKISNYKTLLTVASSLSGLAFAVIPRPLDNILGITFLLFGLPFLVLIIRYSIIKRSNNKPQTTLIIQSVLLLLCFISFALTTIFFIGIYLTMDAENINEASIIIISAITSMSSVVFAILFFKSYGKLRKIKKHK